MPSPATRAHTEGEAPLRFGKYRLHKLLARGGMGEVYLATLVGELGFKKKLVVKTILPEFADKPHFVDLFAAEAKTAVALSHGNIVPIYELGRSDHTLYIVMGYVDGPSVAQMVSAAQKQDREPSTAVAMHIIRGVLTGLAYAHLEEPGREAVVHRDITPRNVLIDRSGQVRIVDFGIALPANVEVNLKAGSTGYMPPEQARAEKADPRMDVFSSACLLYELLTHQKAFPKEGVWISPELADVPEEIRGALGAALSFDPADRPQDAGHFLTELSSAINKHAGTFSDPRLAAHLRAVFPDGWEPDERPASEGITPTPAKKDSKPQTYATRLTAVSKAKKDSKKPTKRDGPRDDADPGHDDATESARSAEGSRLGATRTADSGIRPNTDVIPIVQRRKLWPVALVVGLTTIAVTWILKPERQLPDEEPPWARRTFPTAAELIQKAPPAVVQPAKAVEAKAPTNPVEDPPAPKMHTIEVHPDDVTITVDGDPVEGSNPFELPIPEHGEAKIKIAKPGYAPREFVLSSDQPAPTTVILTKLPPKPRGIGKLKIVAPQYAYAEIRVDGKKVGQTPRTIPLPEGRHRVVIICPEPVCSPKKTLLDKRIEVKVGIEKKISPS